MTEQSLAEALESSMADVLEKMFFIRSLGEPEGTAAEPDVVARVRFEGDPPGSFTLRVTRSSASSIAADFLGADDSEVSEPEVADVICELANMICGSVLSRVESNSTFRLASPRLVLADAVNGPPGPALSASAVHAVGVSGGALVASIETERPGCPQVEEYAF